MPRAGQVRPTRFRQALAGVALFAVGAAGLLTIVPATARAGAMQVGGASNGDSHVRMHRMMDAMHGEGTAERMHAVDGVDEMMDQCAEMMDTMGGMANMMRGMSNGGMDGGGPDMRDMMGR